MAAELIDGLPYLLATVGGAAHPDDVAAALVEGPGRAFGAVAAAIVWARPPQLIVLGLHGFLDDEIQGLKTVGMDVDHPLPHAYRECEPTIVDVGEFLTRYAVATAGSRSVRALRRTPDGSVVSAPIISLGVPIGCFAFLNDRRRTWSPAELGALTAVGATLGMWLTHPVSGVRACADDVPAPTLTGRQRALLALLADGKTSEAAGSVLGVSVSTVKQEVGRIMRSLQVRDRSAAVRRATELGLMGRPR